jgi:hypothetical protein
VTTTKTGVYVSAGGITRFFAADDFDVDKKKKFKPKGKTKMNSFRNQSKIPKSDYVKRVGQSDIPEKVYSKSHSVEETKSDFHDVPLLDKYWASEPLFTNDKAWVKCDRMTIFENFQQYLRHGYAQKEMPVHCDNPAEHLVLNEPSKEGSVNIMTPVKRGCTTWLPEIMSYSAKWDYACRIVGNQLWIAYPSLSNYKIIIMEPNIASTGHQRGPFQEYVLLEQKEEQDQLDTLIESDGMPEEVMIMEGEDDKEDLSSLIESTASEQDDTSDSILTPVNLIDSVQIPIYSQNKKLMVDVPNGLIEMTRNLLRNRKLTDFTMSTVITELEQKYLQTALYKLWGPIDRATMYGCYFYSVREKTEVVAGNLGIDYDLLKQQHDVNAVLLNQPKYTGITGILIKLSEIFLPAQIRDWVKELFAGWQIKRTFSPWENRIHDMAKDKVLPNLMLYLFRSLKLEYSVLLEELIKTLPFGGTVVAFMELYQDAKLGVSIPVIVTKFIAHSMADILTPFGKLITLPFRALFHYLWDKAFEYTAQHFACKQDVEFEYRIEHERKRFTTSIEQGDSGIIPLELIGSRTEKKNENDNIHITFNPTNFTAGSMTGNNIKEAVMKRNLAPYPLEELDEKVVEKMREFSDLVIKDFGTNGDYQPMTMDEWIEMPNHTGPKKTIYKKAKEELQLKGDFSYESELRVKLDETLPKPLMRTLHVFDHRYTVQVAPTVNAFAKTMAKCWDGMTPYTTKLGPLYIKYASKGQTQEINDLIKMHSERMEGYLLLLLGDDSKLTSVLLRTWNCDFSRYDSTQLPQYHQFFLRTFASVTKK